MFCFRTVCSTGCCVLELYIVQGASFSLMAVPLRKKCPNGTAIIKDFFAASLSYNVSSCGFSVFTNHGV